MTRGQLGQAKRMIMLYLNRCFAELEKRVRNGSRSDDGLSSKALLAFRTLQREIGGKRGPYKTARAVLPKAARASKGPARKPAGPRTYVSWQKREEHQDYLFDGVTKILRRTGHPMTAREIASDMLHNHFNLAACGIKKQKAPLLARTLGRIFQLSAKGKKAFRVVGDGYALRSGVASKPKAKPAAKPTEKPAEAQA